MHDEAISPAQRAALLSLAPAAREGFYLAGGTGLCLQLAHRRSIDLDLFCDAAFDPEQVAVRLRGLGLATENVRTQPNTLWLEVEGVPTSLMTFPYETLEPPTPTTGIPVASLRDIAAMKIEAIASRGARKDFFDLYFICQDGLGLGGALAAFQARFASAHPDVAHRMKALTFFDDAEREPDLVLLRPAEWSRVREYFEDEVRALWQRT